MSYLAELMDQFDQLLGWWGQKALARMDFYLLHVLAQPPVGYSDYSPDSKETPEEEEVKLKTDTFPPHSIGVARNCVWVFQKHFMEKSDWTLANPILSKAKHKDQIKEEEKQSSTLDEMNCKVVSYGI